MTKTKQQIRDEAAEKFWDNINRNAETIHARTIFKHGWDSRDRLDNEALKIAVECIERLLFALQCLIIQTNGDVPGLNAKQVFDGAIETRNGAKEALAEIKKIVGEG